VLRSAEYTNGWLVELGETSSVKHQFDHNSKTNNSKKAHTYISTQKGLEHKATKTHSKAQGTKIRLNIIITHQYLAYKTTKIAKNRTKNYSTAQKGI